MQRILSFAAHLVASTSYTITQRPENSPKGMTVENLDHDYNINIGASPIYDEYRRARAASDYLDREMSKLGTNEIPKFKPIKASEQTVY
jgi:hypothetical protein